MEALYQGTEVLVGQAYLDLMSVVLTGSLKDTPVFNKEYFKSILLKESDVLYEQGAAVNDDLYRFTLPDNVVDVPYLNNRVFDSTSALQKHVDYYVSDDRTVEFKYDPLNSYHERTFGSGNAQFTLRTRIPTIQPRVALVQLGAAAPVAVTRFGLDITITFGNTSTALEITQAVTAAELITDMLASSLPEDSDGSGVPSSTSGFLTLDKSLVSPLEGFAARQVQTQFGAKFSDPTRTDWISLGVRKGDILRLIEANMESPINLVRDDALYLKRTTLDSRTSQSYVVLRTLADPDVSEAFPPTGTITQTNTDGDLDSVTGTFVAASSNFSAVHKGDLIVFPSENLALPIADVLSSTSVRLLGASQSVTETGKTWELRTNVQFAATDGAITASDAFSSSSASFTAADIGKLLHIGDSKLLITSVNSTTQVTVDGELPTDAGLSGLTWGLRNFVSLPFRVSRSAPFAWLKAGQTYVRALREQDDQVVRVNVDYRVNVDTGVITPLTVWKPSTEVLVDYQVRQAIVENSLPLTTYTDGAIPTAGGTDFTSASAPFTLAQVGLNFGVTNSSVNNGVYTVGAFTSASAISTTAAFSGTADPRSGNLTWNWRDGTLTFGSTITFDTQTFTFDTPHIGAAISITNAGAASGIYRITSIVSPTSVVVVSDRVDPGTVLNNGTLDWHLLRRGTHSVASTDTIVAETQMSFWAENALVDRELLYTTYGYLINKYSQSSDDYKALLRGIFQLFMLGPTVERFESAINTVAGLDVIREDGEVLIRYTTGATQSGVDGALSTSASTFTSASANFAATNVGNLLYVVAPSGTTHLYRITSVLDANTVTLNEAPVAGSSLYWEMSLTGKQEVYTTRNRYEFDRTIPLKDKVTSAANIGVYTFEAFEVLTAAFDVTDYLENPSWFENIEIPEEVWPEQSSLRRQSSSVLFENRIGPADGALIGDPGFFIGADSEGNVSPTTLLRSGTGGTVFPDPTFPYSQTNVFFEAASALFTDVDRGLTLTVPQGDFRILEVISPLRVRIESFIPLNPSTGVAWSLSAKPRAKRHKAAFVLLNDHLKNHLFAVRFDSSLLDRLAPTLVQDLNDLVLVAKPAYTFIVVSPLTFFQETMQLSEDTLEVTPRISLGGTGGSPLLAQNRVLTIGDQRVLLGSWYRYYDETILGVLPGAWPITPPSVPAGYRVLVTAAQFTAAFPPTSSQLRPTLLTNTDATVTPAVDGSANVVLTSSAPFIDAHLGQYLDIAGQGSFRISAINGPTDVTVWAPTAVAGTGLTWRIDTAGGSLGHSLTDPQGQSLFESVSTQHQFNALDVGTLIERPYATDPHFAHLRILEVLSPTRVRVGETHALTGFFPVTTFNGLVTVTNPGDFTFSYEEATVDRHIVSNTPPRQRVYYLEDALGNRAEITEYAGPTQAMAQGGLVPPTGVASLSVRVVKEQHYVGMPNEVADWHHVQQNYTVDSGQIVLTPGVTAPATTDVRILGLLVPIDPTLQVQDETVGDTLFHISGMDPTNGFVQLPSEVVNFSIKEYPIQITRT